MMDFKIEQVIATLHRTNTSAKMLALVSWNSAPAKLDLRTWRTDGEEMKPCKGISLSAEETGALYIALGKYIDSFS